MTLPPFDLHRARSVEEAGELLARYGDDAVVYCGGTELLLLLKLGFAATATSSTSSRSRSSRGIRRENGTLVIGATVTHRELERSPVVLEAIPALAEMERRVANIRVRNVGTLGGNLCFSDPHSDPATFLLALDAEVECRAGGAAPRRSADRATSSSARTRRRSSRASCSSRSACPCRRRERGSSTRSWPSTSGRP